MPSCSPPPRPRTRRSRTSARRSATRSDSRSSGPRSSPPSPAGAAAAALRAPPSSPPVGPPLEPLAPRGSRVPLLVESPALPTPGPAKDPRQVAVVAAAEELERLGVPTERQTLLVAAGLARRPSRRSVESLVTPGFALRFHGEVAVHDAEDPDLVEVGAHHR